MSRFAIICSTALMSAVSIQTLASDSRIPLTPDFGPPGASGFAAPPAFNQRRIHQGIRVQRGRTPDGYQLRIHTGSEDPASIRVKVEGRSIMISTSESQEEEHSDDRGSYRHFRLSSRSSQRLSLPRDADPDSMKRSQKNGVITLTFARRDPFTSRHPGQQFPGAPGAAYDPRGGYDYGPGDRSGPRGWPDYEPGYRGPYRSAPNAPVGPFNGE